MLDFTHNTTFTDIQWPEITSAQDNVPTQFILGQNVPNPFNPSTTIHYTLPQDAIIRIDIYNAAGQLVATLADGFSHSGGHSVIWDARDVSAGVYFYSLITPNYSSTKKNDACQISVMYPNYS